jgi:HEAT repeat protein
VKALGKLGDPPAVEALGYALGDESPDVRLAVVNVLATLGGPGVIEPLIAALQDKRQSVQKAAISALGRLGNASAVGPLIATAVTHSKLVSIQRDHRDASGNWRPDS